MGRADRAPVRVPDRATETGPASWSRATSPGSLPPGTEVARIDGRPVGEVIGRLARFASGDGRGVDGLRRARLAVPTHAFDGYARSDFDAYYPLVYPDTPERATLLVRRPSMSGWAPVAVNRLTRDERDTRAQAAGVLPPADEDSWTARVLERGTALVRLGTFSTWGFETNPDTLLARTFRDLKRRGARRLVLDIRGVPGGNLGALAVARYLSTEPVRCLGDATVIAARVPAPAFFPYLEAYGGGDGWKNPLPDAAVEPLPDGRYLLLAGPTCASPPVPAEAFDGPVAVLADAWNESATFNLLRVVREQGLGTIDRSNRPGATSAGSRPESSSGSGSPEPGSWSRSRSCRRSRRATLRTAHSSPTSPSSGRQMMWRPDATPTSTRRSPRSISDDALLPGGTPSVLGRTLGDAIKPNPTNFRVGNA